ncbi:MAG: PilZ domain-containing protein [Candidatus Omnitrophica bacterium]|nr:PilZ domain-containing protein [Candidatus Omnitrophota bacterium]
MHSMPERRRDPRLENNIPVKICQEDGDIVTETGNISRSGAYCRVTRYIEPMTKFKMCLLIPIRKKGKDVTKKICCQGVVVRTEPIVGKEEYNIAVFFNDIAPRDAECISDYVNSYLENSTGHN